MALSHEPHDFPDRRVSSKTDLCALCRREEVLTAHHLIPRTRHHNKRNKRDFDRELVRQTIGLCQPCHSQVHALFSAKELERDWNTLDDLRAQPQVVEFVTWLADKPRGFRTQTRKSRR